MVTDLLNIKIYWLVPSVLSGKPIGPIVIEKSRFSEISRIFDTRRRTDTYKMPFNLSFQDEPNGLGLKTVQCVF